MTVLLALGLTAGLLAGCSASPVTPQTAPATSSTPSSAPSPEAGSSPEPAALTARSTAAEVRDAGSVPGPGGVSVAALTGAPDDVELLPAEDGSVVLRFRAPSGAAGARQTLALLAAPDSGAVQVLADGSALVTDASGAPVAGLGPVQGSSAHLEAMADDVVLVVVTGAPGTDPSVTVWLGSVALTSAQWGEREGGRSLAVVPSAWMRAAGLAGQQLGWAQLVAAVPEAGTVTMDHQFVCHAIGAPDKEAWNLEPWRPDVGLLSTMTAQCNP